ncbi:hypothetical protein ABFX02_04G002600 [Erythranthe guttata]
MAKHCELWLPKKKRFCANPPLADSQFCGNHTQRSDSKWILCPIDPSHSVLEENLDSHLSRCPLLKQTQSLTSQPFYQRGINGGREDEEEEENAACKDSIFTSEMKRNAVYAMSAPKFLELIAKIKSVHSSICSKIPESYKIPEACSIWTKTQVDRKVPYQEKHALQQASILGNLEEFGVLKKSGFACDAIGEQCDSNGELEKDSDISTVVEFGAGRGYLTQMLADCYGIKKVLLVERKSYKLKADRSLRQKESLVLERLRIDIEDLNLNAVESLQGVGYMAIGKHLCGPATDMTLRCCINEHCDGHTSEAATGYLRGLAIATCCHHLCQWKSYINKKYINDMGLGKEDFNAITWFTSWAVDADHGSELSAVDSSAQFEIVRSEKKEVVCMESELLSGVGDIVRNMEAIDRAVLGFMCKDIIDIGRLMWVKQQQRLVQSELVKYVPLCVSPENRLLLAAYSLSL